MSKKLKIIIGSCVLILILGLSLVIYQRRANFQAAEDPTNIEAYFSAVITEDGVRANGYISMDGSCPETFLESSDGVYGCTLIVSQGEELTVNSLNLLSFNTDLTTPIPLQNQPGQEGIPFILQPNEYLALEINIDTVAGSISIKRRDIETNELTDFPPVNP